MQVDSFHLFPTERQRHIEIPLCLYFGSDGHLIPECPVRPPRPAVSFIHFPPMIPSLKRTTVSVTTSLFCYCPGSPRLGLSRKLNFPGLPQTTQEIPLLTSPEGSFYTG